MSYSKELKAFSEAYPYKELEAAGAKFRYVSAGEENKETLVFLNGGMNVSEMWMRYVYGLSDEYRVLIFDYPQELKTNQTLVSGMGEFFYKLGIHKPILVGASDGGMIAQLYTQKFPNDVGGLILLSTGGVDADTIKKLHRKYFFAPIMLWYFKRCNYEKLKPRLVNVLANHAKNESAEDKAYVRDMAQTIFSTYTKEKDIHISTLLWDLMNQTPVTADTFAKLKGKIMLILPNDDFFSGEMQKTLISLMHDPKIICVKGGHLSTVLRADEHIKEIRAFIAECID